MTELTLPPHRLYPPGTRKNNKTYVARLSWKGARAEFVTGATTEEAAREYVRRVAASFGHGPAMREVNRLRVIPQPQVSVADRLAPEAIFLGPFERWLFETYYWSEGLILCRTGGILRFYNSAHGYRAGKVLHEGEVRSVLEHRLVFLLVYGWLPQSIDHKNRDRGDNRPSNLAPSTPLLQARNRFPLRNFPQ